MLSRAKKIRLSILKMLGYKIESGKIEWRMLNTNATKWKVEKGYIRLCFLIDLAEINTLAYLSGSLEAKKLI